MVTASPPRAGGPAAEATARQVAGRRWRSARGVVAAVLALIAVAVVLAALRPSASAEALDPESPKQDGSRALAEILRRHGTPVTVARKTGDAVGAAGPGTVLVVTRTERLTEEDLARLSGVPADVLLVRPTSFALEAFAPQVRRRGPSLEEVAAPGCALPVASLAGAVDFHESETYEVAGAGTSCYRTDYGDARLVQVSTGAHTVTVLGSTAPLTNRRLTEEGNAALGMNLAGAGTSAVWLARTCPRRAPARGSGPSATCCPSG